MGTSGEYGFTLQRNELVTNAFYLMNWIPKGQPLAAEDLNYGITQLNNMVNSWQRKDIYLWKYETIALFPQYGQYKYVLSPTTTDHATLNYNQTTLTSPASATATTITVLDPIGFVIGYNIGIVTDSNVVFWTTISSVSGSTIGLTDALTLNALQGSNVVFVYQNKTQKPLKMKYATLLSPKMGGNNTGGYEIQLVTLARKDYQTLSTKSQPVGYPSQVMFEPRRTEGWIWLSQAPAVTNQVIKLNCVYPFEDFASANDDADFPAEWTDTLVWNLAKKLIPAYGVEGARSAEIKEEADMLFQQLLDYDMEDTYLQIDISVFPNRRWGR